MRKECQLTKYCNLIGAVTIVAVTQVLPVIVTHQTLTFRTRVWLHQTMNMYSVSVVMDTIFLCMCVCYYLCVCACMHVKLTFYLTVSAFVSTLLTITIIAIILTFKTRNSFRAVLHLKVASECHYPKGRCWRTPARTSLG